MVERTRELELSLGVEVKKVEENELETVVLQRRAIRSKINIKSGEKINEKNIIALRPCPKEGILPFEKEKILNKKTNKDITKGDLIKWEDLV